MSKLLCSDRDYHLGRVVGLMSMIFMFMLPEICCPEEPLLMDIASCCGTTMTRELESRRWEELARDKSFLSSIYPCMFAGVNLAVEQTKATDGRVFTIAKTGPRCLAFGITVDRPTGIVYMVLIFSRHGALWFEAFPTIYGSISKGIRDLDGDGTMEVIVHDHLASSTDRINAVVWPKVYRYKNGAYMEASKEFPAFYREYLVSIQSRLREVDAYDAANTAKEEGRDIGKEMIWNMRRQSDLLVGQFFTQQILGDKRAGFSEAMKWADSDDFALKQNAITLFSAIRDSNSLRYLERLSLDKDPHVSRRARESLTAKAPSQ